MNVKSVASMIKQAASNANLYDKMLAAGYTDGEVPSWWYSPGRASGEGAAAGETVDVPAEGGEPSIEVDKVERVDGYDPTPPRIPAPREGRPALQAQHTNAIQSNAKQAEQGSPPSPPSASFSDAELSLLAERGITEITPGRWMRTMEQADDRIVLTPVDPRQELLDIRRALNSLMALLTTRVRNGTIPLFTRLQSWANVNPSNSSGNPRRILDTWAFQCFHPEDDTWLGTRAHPHNRRNLIISCALARATDQTY